MSDHPKSEQQRPSEQEIERALAILQAPRSDDLNVLRARFAAHALLSRAGISTAHLTQ